MTRAISGYHLEGSVPLIFEKGAPGRRGYRLPELDADELPLDELIPPEHQRQQDAPLPEVSELEAVRHFIARSRRNYGVDVGFYPLGSCTMKYNPKVNELMASLRASHAIRTSSRSGARRPGLTQPGVLARNRG